MSDVIKGIFYLIALPYILLWDILRWGINSNSGHTAGLGLGFMFLIGFISGAVQLIVALLVILIIFVF